MQSFLKNLLENKFSKSLLKRNKGVGVTANTDYINRNNIIKQFNKDKRSYAKSLSMNMKMLMSGKVTRDEYLKLQRNTIRTHFTKSFLAGKQFAQSTEKELTSDEKNFISYQLGQEMKFMNRFADDIINNRGKMDYNRRMSMYAGGVDPMFEFGNLAYLPEEIEIHWRLGATDKHCVDCISIAMKSPYNKKNLPAVPRSGNTRCLNNCCCEISYQERYKKQNNYVSFITKNYTNKRKFIPTETEVEKIIETRDKYYYERLNAVFTKDKTDLNTAKIVKTSLFAYITSKELSVRMVLPVSKHISEFKHFMKSDLFQKITDISELKIGDTVSMFYGGKQVYGKVFNISNDVLIVSTLDNKREVVDISKTHIFKEI